MSSPKNVFPKTRQDVFAIKSWGYKDCYFYYDQDKKCLCFKGDKYPELHNAQFHKAELIFKDLLHVDVAKLKPPHPNGSIPNFKFLHVDCERFREDMNERGIDCSITIEDRCFRGSGQSAQDLVKPCHFRIPDIVVWPKRHDDVEFVVKKANEHNVVIIPFGGGTNVTCSINCPENETRTIVSLDTTQMNKMLWLDEKSGLACFEAGVGGQGLESHLNERGFTLGHEPDSVEFSTLGGWISTRSSGIKQQFYGNIDKIVIKVRVVTSVGTFDKPCTPRASMGPEIENLIFGHEGTFGVITEAVVKVHKIPPSRQYGSFLFVDFQTGINFMRECAMKKCLPTSLRLIDSYQISYGSAMSYHNSLFSKMKEFVQLKAMNFLFDTSKVSMAVFLMEGQKDDVSKMERSLIKIARTHGAWQGGPAVGQKGYFITFTVGYMRDMMIRLDSIHDSLETSVTWDKLEGCIENTTKTFNEQIKKITAFGTLSYRISQIYHEGVCIYFYLGIGPCDNQRDSFLHICGAIKDTLMKSGASLSHHHGVGKRGQDKLIKYLPNTTKKVLRAIKRDIDPKNIFAVGNLIFNGGADELNAKL